MKPTDSSTSCPFCRGSNKCQAGDKSPCWCFNATIPAELIELLPQNVQNKSCICFACVNLFNNSPKRFRELYLKEQNS